MDTTSCTHPDEHHLDPPHGDVRTPRTGGDAATLALVGEAGVLAAIMPHLAAAAAEVGPGDDAAVLPPTRGRTVVTTDSMVLGLDWRDDWSSAHDVGVKVIAQNIADVVAMGAQPTGVVVALAAEDGTRVDWLVELTQGMADELGRAGCGALGGDLSGAAAGTLVITVTALGVLPIGVAPLLRSGACAGDVIALSDVVGRSHAGLLLLLGEGMPPGETTSLDTATGSVSAEACLAAHRAPRPRYAGNEAIAAGVHAAMDVSDGLGRDAARLAHASGVAIELDPSAIERMAAPLVAVVGERAFECVVAGGEEHCLLAACPPGQVPAGWHPIGQVSDGEGVWLGGQRVSEQGWSHFG